MKDRVTSVWPGLTTLAIALAICVSGTAGAWVQAGQPPEPEGAAREADESQTRKQQEAPPVLVAQATATSDATNVADPATPAAKTTKSAGKTEDAKGNEQAKAGGEGEAGDLAKAAQNPIANMISVPLQHNFNFKTGPGDDLQNILNIQPVIPLKLTEDWNVITRTILPVIWQPELAPGVGPESGLGDIQFSAFFSPVKPTKGVTWGVGPVLQFPSATDDLLGSGKYSAGPTAVALKMDGPWVYGALVQNLWSYAGDGDREEVNQFLIQPFLNYNLPKGWYLSTGPSITANWRAHGKDRWTVPVGGGVGKIMKIGKLPVNMSLRAYYNVMRPSDGPEWTLQYQIQFMFPK